MRICITLLELAVKIHHERILEQAAALTFKLCLAFFPFLVFLMALLGFLELSPDAVFRVVYQVLPEVAATIVSDFVMETSGTRSGGVLSVALLICIYNSTAGLGAIIHYANLAYDKHDRRSALKRTALGFVIMLLLSFIFIIMIALFVFGRHVVAEVFPQIPHWLLSFVGLVMSMAALVLVTCYVYKLAVGSMRFLDALPGATLTVLAWAAVSQAFGYFTTNISQFPAIYGSIAGVFVLILWLNLVSVILLVGNALNALRARPLVGGGRHRKM